MATSVIHPDRVRRRTPDGREPQDGRYVLYWMQRAQRAEHNDALEYAARLANERSVPLLVCFGLAPEYPAATARHYRFMLEGLGEVATGLRRRGIGFVIRVGSPPEVAVRLSDEAVAIVIDRAYERHLVEWREQLIRSVGCPVIEVEADVVVPVDVASDKREYAARTIRPKLLGRLDGYLQKLTTTSVDHQMRDVPPGELDLADVDGTLNALGLDADTEPHLFLRGGTAKARARLRTFLQEGLEGYAERRPDPVDPAVSYLSPYLHFGQISPVVVALAVRGTGAPQADIDAFIEELVVRRELAANFVRHEPEYDRFAALPPWARKTLDEHRDDERDAVYTATQLEQGRTHDQAWNAAMAQVRETGYLHNHLRMYWGKQVLRWTRSPEHAFRTLLALNDRYFLDGRDCSSVSNVAWVFGLHDQAFAERSVSGKTRPMTRTGLDRKFDVRGWLAHVRATLGDSAVDGPGGEAVSSA